MTLDEVIPPEIKDDSFYSTLMEMATRSDLKTFLEIGSSSGGGSTQALVEGILRRKIVDAKLFCLEVSRVRYTNLVEAYERCEFVFPYNLSSIKISDFPSEEEVAQFYTSTKTNLNKYDLKLVLGWLRRDVAYIEHRKLDHCGIEFVKACNNLERFDFVLIDGSEFTGERELHQAWGAKVIALDDVNAYKSFAAYRILSNHHAYRLLVQDLGLRNGYAFFERLW